MCLSGRCRVDGMSPYSSVVEHPLSKRKVDSSILSGGIIVMGGRSPPTMPSVRWSVYRLFLFTINKDVLYMTTVHMQFHP